MNKGLGTLKFWHKYKRFLLPLSYLLFLLPGGSISTNSKIILSLASIFIIPGYLVFRWLYPKHLTQRDFWENLILCLGGSLSLLWIPWTAVYFGKISIIAVFWGICGFDILGLLAIALTNASKRESTQSTIESEGAFPLGLLATLAFATLCALVIFFFGAQLIGDAISYRAWSRNLYNGDIAPSDNIEASWETRYPGFKYKHPFVLLVYSSIAKAIGIDPDEVWVIVPAFFTFLFLGVNSCWTKFVFKEQRIAHLAVFLTPFIFAKVLPQMVGPSILCNYIFLPVAILLAMWYLREEKSQANPLLAIFSILIAMLMAVEHTQHFIYYLLILGCFMLIRLLVERKLTHTVWRTTQLILAAAILPLPYLLWILSLASNQQYNPTQATVRHFARGPYFLGNASIFIVNPTRLFGNGTGLALTLWVLIGVFTLSNRQRWKTVKGSALLAILAPVALIGLNPLLAPLLSRLVAPQVVYRLGAIIPTSMMAAFCLIQVTERLQLLWNSKVTIRLEKFLRSRGVPLALAVGFLAFPAFGLHLFQMGFDVAEAKLRQVFFSPRGASPNWLDNELRSGIERRLVEDPFYILLEPVEFILLLDRPILTHMRNEIPSDSVFLAEPMVEGILPSYADQLAFRGRRIMGATFERLGDETLPSAARERRAIASIILDPDTPSNQIAALLNQYRDEIDYVLITPKIMDLRTKLDQIESVQKVYDLNGLALYRVE